MSSENSTWIDVVAKLIKLTQDGELVWKPSEPPLALKDRANERIELVFTASYKHKTLRLYEWTFRTTRPRQYESALTAMQRAFGIGGSPDLESYWETEVVLEFVNDNGLTLWTVPSVNVLDDLLSSVQYQVAGVKDFLKEVLSEES